MTLALQLCRFPQATMRADRRAAYYSTYDAKSWADALKYEYECGMDVLGDDVAGTKSKNKVFGFQRYQLCLLSQQNVVIGLRLN